jgi:hypothetical protein
VSVTPKPEQTDVELELILTETGRFGFTVIVIALEVAGLPLTHAAPEVIMHVTTSPLESADEVNAGEFVPALIPFTFHWYDGLPPLTGVAVNVTEVPAHIAPEGNAEIVTDAVDG